MISFAILDPLEALCSTIALVPEGLVFLGIYSMFADLNYLDIHTEINMSMPFPQVQHFETTVLDSLVPTLSCLSCMSMCTMCILP